ncbi:MAG: PHP domain-containing protein [Clostridia bacterium]|nr:PHP domain-containing protein [Clostridia bacterium]
MIQDIHSHTYYSFCGADKPEQVVEAAIAGGIELFGICDHNYGIGFGRHDLFLSKAEDFGSGYGRTLVQYFDHINLIKEKYADRIKLLRGIEVATLKDGRYALPEGVDISFFDYCLIENLDWAETYTEGDLFAFAKRCKCPAGVAHTDLFAHAEKLGIKPLDYFSRMAEENIFWEMNVSYDSIHKYREHAYMLRFFEDEEQQEIVRRSGVRLSVGFDGHRCNEYRPDRVADYCRKIENMGIKMAFED